MHERLFRGCEFCFQGAACLDGGGELVDVGGTTGLRMGEGW